MMDCIYGGAWATIVALHGEFAGSGLPRMRSETQSWFPFQILTKFISIRYGLFDNSRPSATSLSSNDMVHK
jgi:hypothetical protein